MAIKKRKPTKIASRQAKGRRLQVLVAQMISELTGLPCGKDEEIESRPGRQSGPDVRLSKKARELFPFTVEAKNQESWSIPAAIRQCQNNIYQETDWLVVCAKNNVKPIAIVDLEVFFKILRKANDKSQD